MTAASIPNTIVNLTPADAVPVQQNFSYLQTFLNSEMINRDGSVAMAAPLTLSGAPTQTLQAANKGYVDSFFPVGIMFLYPGNAAPAGDWMLCQGQALSTATFPALFAVLGYRYGGAGATFNLPDLRNRVPIGKDTGIADVDETGKTGGTTTTPLLAHTHTMAHTHEHPHTHTIAHTHDIDHNHGSISTSGDDGAHSHLGRALGAQTGAGSFLRPTNLSFDSEPTVTYTGGQHQHTVDLPNFTGTSGASSAANSGAASDATTGASSAANTGSAGANPTYRPPFLVVNYIIRTK